MKQLFKNTGIALLITGLASCTDQTTSTASTTDSTHSETDNKMKDENGKWIRLFDGNTLNGWHAFNKPGKIENWTIEDSAMVCLGAAEGDIGGDIVSDNEYEDFELTWDWKITKGGNTGVMYHVVEDSKYKAPWETGPEYQLIDDVDFPDKLEEWQKTGANYAMNVTNDNKKVNPVGEWNTSKIISNKGHVEHWLNGEKVLEFEAGNEAWKKEKNEGKWKDFPDYGSAKKGRISLQDHGNKAYFKTIMIREL